MIQNKSMLDHKHKLEKARLAKLKKQRQIGDAVKNYRLAHNCGARHVFA